MWRVYVENVCVCVCLCVEGVCGGYGVCVCVGGVWRVCGECVCVCVEGVCGGERVDRIDLVISSSKLERKTSPSEGLACQ